MFSIEKADADFKKRKLFALYFTIKQPKENEMKKPPDVILSTVSTLLQMPSSDLIEMLSNHHANKGQQKEAEWLTLEEAAQFARVSRWTIRRWCQQGKLDFRKTNRARCGRIIIRATSLCSLIDSFNNPED